MPPLRLELERGSGVHIEVQLELDPVDVWMVELAQESGAGANYAGSGGAIVALPRDASELETLRARLLRDGFGCVSI